GGTSGSLLDGLSGIGGGSGLIGGTPNQTGDTDLTLDATADLPLVAPIIADVDVNLDPVEDLLGTDIDVDLDAVADLDQAIAAADSLLGSLDTAHPADTTSTGDTDLSLHLDAFGQITGDVDINLDVIEQLLATDIDVDVGFGLDLGNFDTLAGTDSGLSGGNLTLSELLTLDSGTSSGLVTNTLDASTSSVSAVTTSTTSTLTSLTQSLTGKFGGGLFG
ncbi:hypothetical protein, partial [Rhizobium sp. AAP43]|uniref:hypothetical protein n=1 Tax=Rhizobium sp. AAP43 TaxID=1523420 RepID=UPI0006CD9A64